MSGVTCDKRVTAKVKEKVYKRVLGLPLYGVKQTGSRAGGSSAKDVEVPFGRI